MIYFDGIIYSWQKGGGIRRYFSMLIASLESRRIDATLVLREPSYDSAPAGTDHLRVERVGSFARLLSKLSFSLARKALSPIDSFLMGKRLRKAASGVFHSTYYTTFEGLKIPQVLTVHDMTYEKFPAYFGGPGAGRFIRNKKRCIEEADAIICVSEATKKNLRDLYKVPDEKIRVIYHGVGGEFNPDYDRALAGHLSSEHNIEKPFILFVGNRGIYKNFSFFLRSFANWSKKSEYDIAVAGGGAFDAAERKLIEGLGLERQIKHFGQVSDDELKTLYCLSKAFIFPSLDEGFGLPILEAISCGARVLASDIPVFREIGYNVPIFFNPSDSASLMKALTDLAALPALTSSEKAAQAKLIKNSFSWERCFDQTVELYKSLQK